MEREDRAGRLVNIQALRGAAALLVFAAHLHSFEFGIRDGNAILPDFLYFGVTGVDLFFLISGFIMVHVTTDLKGGRRQAQQFLFNRMARIYPLYWAAAILLLAVFVLRQFIMGEPFPATDLLTAIFLLPDAKPFLNVSWTLTHELYFYGVFTLIVLAARNIIAPLFVFWASVILLAGFINVTPMNAWTNVVFSPLSFEFMGGAIIAIMVRNGVTRGGFYVLGAGVILLAIITFLMPHSVYPTLASQHVLRTSVYLAPYALILYGAISLELHKPSGLLAPSWLCRLGDASYALYLVHVPVLLVIARLVSSLIDTGLAASLIFIPVATGACLITAFLAHYFIEKPSLTLFRKASKRYFDRSYVSKDVKPA